jgi:hypothetical protein
MRQLIKCLKAQTELLDVIEKEDMTHMTLTLATELWVEELKCSKTL